MLINFFSNDFNFAVSIYALILFCFILNFKFYNFIFTSVTILLTLFISTTTNNYLFLSAWGLSSITLLFASINSEISGNNTYYFTKYLTYLAGDLLFFSLSLIFPDLTKLFLFIPLIIRGGLIPFNFFSLAGTGKKLVTEYQQITLNYFLIITFLTKYNYNNSILSLILLSTIFFTSFGLLKKDDSTNIITTIYTICLQMCLLFFVNENELMAKSATICTILTFCFLNFFIPQNIPKTVLTHKSRFSINIAKVISLLLIFSCSVLPIFFSSNIFLGTLEIASFYSWSNKSSYYFTPLFFLLIAWFLINFNWALAYITKIILSTVQKTKKIHKTLQAACLPVIFILIANYPYTGNITFLNNSNLSPIANINYDLENYIIYFYLPIIIFSLLGIYFQFLFGNRIILRKICLIIFSVFSLRYLYDNLNFSKIQTFMSEIFNFYYEHVNRIPSFFHNLFLTLKKKLVHFFKMLDSVNQIIIYFLNIKFKKRSENLVVYLVLFFLLLLAFLSTLKENIYVTMVLLLVNFIFIFILTSTGEEE